MGSYRHSLIIAMTFFLVLDAIVVASRVFVRAKLIHSFGWDDGLLCLSFFGYIMCCVLGFLSIHYGFAADAGEHQTYFNTTKMHKFYWANQLCLYLSSGMVKVAVALVLYRLATTARNRIVLAASIVVVVIWTGVTTVFSSYICADNPNGATNFAGSKMCSDVGYFRMISNIFIDYFFALYPIPMLWRANLQKGMKIIVCGLLGLGVLASAATVAKLVILVELQKTTGYREDWLHYQLLEWADVELGLAIFAASTAALRPLYRHLTGHSLPDISTTDKSATAVVGTVPAQISGTGVSREHLGEEISGSANGSEQYELETFNSKEPTLKIQDEEEGQQSSIKETRSMASE